MTISVGKLIEMNDLLEWTGRFKYFGDIKFDFDKYHVYWDLRKINTKLSPNKEFWFNSRSCCYELDVKVVGDFIVVDTVDFIMVFDLYQNYHIKED